MNNPFYCEKSKAIVFKWRALRDIVFILPEMVPKKYNNSLIHVPEIYQKYYKTGRGLVISVGPGIYSIEGVLCKTGLKPGMMVGFDKDVPWGITEAASDGNNYFVVMCGAQDVRFEVC